MTLKSQIVNFLKTNPELKKVNFRFMTHRIYPSGYSVDVADLIDKDYIGLSKAFFGKAAASYLMDSNKMILSNSFSITSDYDLSFLVHECTHALSDYQKAGYGSRFEHEAVGYLAEAFWREAKGLTSLGGTGIRTITHKIAASMLSSGNYTVSASDGYALLNAVRAEPHYKTKSDETYIGDGF